MGKDKLLTEFVGAYTTARTVDRKAVFELSMHCERLNVAAREIFAKEPTTVTAAEFLHNLGPDGLRPLLKREMRTALAFLSSSSQSGAVDGDGPDGVDDVDYQVTILLTTDSIGEHTPAGRGFDVFTFAQPLPWTPPAVEVLALRGDRPNPTIKDARWVKERRSLEEEQAKAGANEVVMLDAEGRISEGLQTNFVAIERDGTLVTAPDDAVLAGTVRKVALEAAAKLGLPAPRFEQPRAAELDAWESCFICSTSRLVKPIRRLVVPAFHLAKDFAEQDSHAHRLEAAVLAALRARAEPILDVDDADECMSGVSASATFATPTTSHAGVARPRASSGAQAHA